MRGGFMLARGAPFIGIKDDSFAENKKARMHACGLFSQGKKIRQARGSAPARMPLGEAVINILASGD